ncbi:helix-turn-helix domain-containing protein [Cupriavidus pinatubonensis]|uniref:helix-turn-helix domain-containing protein n=1 Tax=Cupriavidus pinatubonensis TaxID=248026 RepID=UPI0011280BA7|nr:helix-turn-helix domain-containing protein [Cupriavidus pinatubonensis]TPQ30084.1 Crp/Fnr family transcriptional regulator [Cupriavidus pinatubonensis]
MFGTSIAGTTALTAFDAVTSEAEDFGRIVSKSPKPKAHCSACALRHICLASSLDEKEAARLRGVVLNWRTVRQGRVLYRAGDPFHSVYALRSGSFKTVLSHQSGREYVSGFFLPGETLGLDGIATEQHTCDAVALEDSAVCVIPFHLLESLCREVKPLQQHVHKMLSAEIVRETGQRMLLGNLTAEQRVAAYLLEISARFERRGYSATDFTLRMTREEIGSYLGLTLETVSRTLSRFQQEGMIRVHGKQITLCDLEAFDVCWGQAKATVSARLARTQMHPTTCTRFD